MKILAIGDPHGEIEKIKKIPMKGVDLILIVGDLGKADIARKRFFENIERKKKGLPELKEDAKLSKQVAAQMYGSTLKIINYLVKFAPVYSLTGNVWMSDNWVKKDEKKFNIKLPHLHEFFRKKKNFTLARNISRKFGDLKVGFLEYFADISWAKETKEKDKKSLAKAKKQTEKASRILGHFKKLDILVCHQPPYGYLDKITWKTSPHKGKRMGSKVILNYIKKYQPRYVFCGHVHEGEGKTKIGKTEVYNLGVGGHKIIEL